jgi:hypothetical protein
VPKRSFKSWINQKRRHVSTAKHYKRKHKLLLALSYFLNLLFWVFASILLISIFKWPFVIGLLLLRLLIQYIVIGFSSKKLKETDLLILLPFLEIFLVTVQLFIFINNIVSKPNHWK